MRVLDKFELAASGEFACTILANPATSDFELVDLDLDLPLGGLSKQIAERALYFLGTVSIRNGAPCSALDDEMSGPMRAAIAQAYLRHISTKKFNQTLEDFELRCLYARSSDMRPN